jgi:nucleoside-diphosphate-sugar epimerase
MKILLIGGAGYVGTELAEYLVDKNHEVTVYDLFIYGDNFSKKRIIKKIRGDIRKINDLENIIKSENFDAIIHLACISNDPSFDLDPNLGKSINFDPFEDLVKIAVKYKISKFIYASSSSVYGIKSEPNVDESFSLEPITDYSKFKAKCEKILKKYNSEDFCTTIIRPATVCGFSKRLRLDLVVNILSNLAYHKKEITVFGGKQFRPNIHIKDMCRSYLHILNQDHKKVSGQIFNVGLENHTVESLALIVKKVMGQEVFLKYVSTNDNRSYHISSKKIVEETGFIYKYKIEDAVIDLKDAFEKKILKDTLNNPEYFNIKKMNLLNLK